MGIFNQTDAFTAVKQKTMPYKKTPKSIQEVLDISAIHENGIFEIGSPQSGEKQRLYDRCYSFHDINYMDQDLEEQQAICLSFCRFLSAMRMDFKLVTANEPQDEEAFRESLSQDPEKSDYPQLAEYNNELVETALASTGRAGVRRGHYLILTCRAADMEKAVQQFSAIDATIGPIFESMGTRLTPMEAVERLGSLRRFFRGAVKERPLSWQYLSEEGRDWRNDVLSPSIGHKKRWLEFEDRYVQILFASYLPGQLNEEKVTHDLTDFDFPIWLTLDTACIPRRALIHKLENVNLANGVAINKELQNAAGQGVYTGKASPRREKLDSSTQRYMDQISSNDEDGFYTGILLAVQGNNERELKDNVAKVRHQADSLNIDLMPYTYEQLQAMNTVLPIGARRVAHMRPLLTTSYVAFQPFHAFDLIQPGGFYYGINKRTGNIVFGDRKTLKNGGGVIIGHTGSGKSMILKITEIGQALIRTDDDIFCIDPQNEMEPVASQFNGEFFDMSGRSNVCLNPLETPEEILYGTDEAAKEIFIVSQSTFMESFMYSIMVGMIPNAYHKTLIYRCVKIVYDSAFSAKDPISPDLRDLKATFEEQPEEEARDLYSSLEAFTDYGVKTLAGQSTFNPKSRFVVFGLRGVAEQMWEPVMLTILHVLAQRMEYNISLQKATRFIVDEAQYVSSHEKSCAELEKAFLTYRKFGGITTICLQNAAAATANPRIQNIVSNSDFKLLLDQGGNDRNELSEILEFSEKEFAMLANPEVGQCLLVWENRILPVNTRISRNNPLYDIYSTNFHEKARGKVATVNQKEQALPVSDSDTEEKAEAGIKDGAKSDQ